MQTSITWEVGTWIVCELSPQGASWLFASEA